MSRASFLDRSPEVSFASAFAIWIRWWLKRKLKGTLLASLPQCLACPCDQLPSERSLFALSPTIVPHHRFQMNAPRGNGTHVEARATPRTATSALVHLMEHRSLWREHRGRAPDRAGTSAKRTVCASLGRASFSPLSLSCSPNELHT